MPLQSMKLDEAALLCVNILKQTMEEKLNSTNIEVSLIPTDTKTFKILSTEEIEALIAKL